MKKTTLWLLLMASTIISKATVRTVNNNGGAQFTDINDAVIASSISDTVYICGSPNAYIPPTTRKDSITFIGTGFNVQNQNLLKSTIASGAFNVGNRNRLIGLDLNSQLNYLDGTNGLVLQRCYIVSNFISNGNYQISNLTIDGSVINGSLFVFSKLINTVISNSIFYGNFPFNQIQTPNNALVDHCVFVQYVNNPQFLFAGTPPSTGFSFSNNVFFNVVLPSVSGFSYVNNFYNSYSPPINNYGTGNIIDGTWPFATPQSSFSNVTIPYLNDFSLLATSYAHNAATDGTDIGAYGGFAPFFFDGEPPIPQMTYLNILGTQFPSGGTLNINFQSSVHY